MKAKNKVIIVVFFTVLAALLNWNTNFAQVVREESFFYSGIIRTISGDSRSITINKKSFLLQGDTKVVDQEGNKLGIHELKPGIDVAIDAIQGSAGLVIKKIVVIKNPGV
jgi:hypothetical protein